MVANKMRKMILFLLIIALMTLTGCGVYGAGKTYGYVTTLESGLFWNFVWVRAELESSQTDCYVFSKDNLYLETQLNLMAKNKERIEMTYKRHLFTLASICLDDEIVSVQVV